MTPGPRAAPGRFASASLRCLRKLYRELRSSSSSTEPSMGRFRSACVREGDAFLRALGDAVGEWVPKEGALREDRSGWYTKQSMEATYPYA